jgi:allantoinase
MALQRHPEVTRAFVALGHEIACHGWRWISYQQVDEATEREHMRAGIEAIRQLTGQSPLGWYTGRDSPNTRRLLATWAASSTTATTTATTCRSGPACSAATAPSVPHLVVPYTLDCNDMRFALPQGFATGEDFFVYLRDSFDALWAEGAETPRMMSVGMHCRLLGRPGRIVALQRFLDHVARHDRVWVCRRIDIARHWRQHFPAP